MQSTDTKVLTAQNFTNINLGKQIDFSQDNASWTDRGSGSWRPLQVQYHLTEGHPNWVKTLLGS